MSLHFSQLAFDLDDTLLDTSKLLIPQASRQSCQAMIATGLACTEEQCLAERLAFTKKNPRHHVYQFLIERFGAKPGSSAAAIEAAGYHAFHNRVVETGIDVFPGVRDLLTDLRSNYQLHLVTSGNRGTQEQKVRILKLEELFDEIHFVDPIRGQSKQNEFIKIMTETKTRPEHCLSIGNRLDNEIYEAKEVGWKTCWMKHGEYATMKPRNPFETPDYTISTIEELKTKCQL